MFGAGSSIALTGFVGIGSWPANALDPITESAFPAQVVGKSLHYGKRGSLMFRDDGSSAGALPKGAASGSWAWQDADVCDQITVAAKAYPRGYRSPEIEANRIRPLTNDGRIHGKATIR